MGIEKPSVNNHITILVVDDSSTARLQAKKLLSKEGYEVVEAQDGQLGYYMMINKMPALIISDVDMPKLDGFGLLSKIRKDIRFRHLPVLFITGDLTVHLGDERTRNVNGLLHKPYVGADLQAQVQFLLSMHSLQGAPQAA